MIRSRFVLATSLLVLALCGASTAAFALPGVPESYQRLDGIIAVVGDEIVLASDVRERVLDLID